MTAGNVHDSVAWDKIYDNVTSKFDVQFVAMDAGYKTPWIAKKTLDDGKVPVLPYTRYKGNKEGYRPWDYKYDPVKDVFRCPHGQELRHTTTGRDGKRIYRSTPKNCVNCPSKACCKANKKGQKVFTTHIWQEYLDIVESIRKTDLGKQIYAQRKETIERVFADAKEKHAMRYTHHRGFAAQFCDTLAHSSDFTAAITDRDSVIATAGPGKRELIGHNLSREMEQLMEGRSVYQRTKEDDALPVCEGSAHLIAATAAPILCQGDVLGLVLFAAGEGELPGESEYKLAQIVAAFLGRHMEA